MSKCLYCQTELPEGYGMVCSSCEKDLLNHSGDCRKCLHFDYCTDKGNHAYRGCNNYFVNKDEYVRVIRCINCKKWEQNKMPFDITKGTCHNPKFHLHYGKVIERCFMPMTNATDFCSYGERKDAECLNSSLVQLLEHL